MYSCPMHPNVVQDKPGMCPECGMNLVKLKVKSEKLKIEKQFDKHEGHGGVNFLQKFWLSLILTIPVLLFSDLFQNLLRFRLPDFPGSKFLPLIFSSIVFFYAGWVFIASAFRELKARLPGMMTLIALAISAAYFYSLYATFAGLEGDLYWELTTLITIMLLGHYLEMRAVQGAQSALKELSKLLPDTAEIIVQSSQLLPSEAGFAVQAKLETKTIPISDLKINDVVLVRPGGKIPVDGLVVDGSSSVNEAMITGESKPVDKKKESEVIAGTINGDGSLQIKVTKIGENTFLAGIMRLVAEAQASKSRLQILSDKAAFVLTIVAVVSGGITFVAWMVGRGDVVFAMERLVAVLVIACPHALGLAVPLVASISTTLGARSGLLIKKRLALETARNIDVVLFDKTGTLTTGEYGVDKIITNNQSPITNNQLLQLAASVDSHSEHFVAKAIVNEAVKQKLSLLSAKNFSAIPGHGVVAEVDGKKTYVGGAAILDKFKVSLDQELVKMVDEENNKGKTVIFVFQEDSGRVKLLGGLSLSDQIRDESKETIRKLNQLGVKSAMITGDAKPVAQWVANELAMDQYFARVLPQDKASKVKILQQQGQKVAMVGDGINDAPALTQADLGIAIGAGTNVAIESAGIILVKNNPNDIVKIINLSRITYQKMIQNLFWATGYNVIALPLAAGALAFKGIILQPALAALLMSVSTVIVAVNAMMLKKINLESR